MQSDVFTVTTRAKLLFPPSDAKAGRGGGVAMSRVCVCVRVCAGFSCEQTSLEQKKKFVLQLPTRRPWR